MVTIRADWIQTKRRHSRPCNHVWAAGWPLTTHQGGNRSPLLHAGHQDTLFAGIPNPPVLGRLDSRTFQLQTHAGDQAPRRVVHPGWGLYPFLISTIPTWSVVLHISLLKECHRSHPKKKLTPLVEDHCFREQQRKSRVLERGGEGRKRRKRGLEYGWLTFSNESNPEGHGLPKEN